MKRTKKKAPKKKSKAKARDKMVYGAPRPIEELIDRGNEDLADAWDKLRGFENSLGEQRIYTSEKAIMFARRICHAFVRPKKSYLELCFFLSSPVKSTDVKVQERSKVKYAHTFRLIHPDQVEEPLTDWLREAFELSE
jgi:hypothetical protein